MIKSEEGEKKVNIKTQNEKQKIRPPWWHKTKSKKLGQHLEKRITKKIRPASRHKTNTPKNHDQENREQGMAQIKKPQL